MIYTASSTEETNIPRNGSGIYSKASGTTAISNDPIGSAKYNASVDDFVADANLARPVVAGGTGASSASGARTALGVEIGTDVQAFSTKLTNYNDLVLVKKDVVFATGPDTFDRFKTTTRFRTFASASSKSEQRTDLGLGSSAEAALLDEDDMVSDDATAVASQQSIKAYVDASKPTWGFTSGELTMVAATTLIVPHGLTAAPTRFSLRYRCKVVDLGWAVGDEVHISTGFDDVASAVRGPVIYTDNADTTNIKIMFPGGVVITNKTTYARAAMTMTSWKLIVSASL